MANHPALVAITPQTPHNNSNSFIKNITSRSSFCGTPTSSNKAFITNRKSWNGNGTLPLQATNCHIDISPVDNASPPILATFKSGTGTFPRKNSANQREIDQRESYQRNLTNFAAQRNDLENCNDTECRSNLPRDEVLTPNGNTGSGGNEMKRAPGNNHARRYAEIGNWSARSSTFLEPHVQGVGWRTAPDSDKQEDHSTEDDEQLLIKDGKSHQTKKPFIFHRDSNQDTSESEREHKTRAEQLRERFEQKQASRKDEVDGFRSHDASRNQEVNSVNRMAKELLDNSTQEEVRRRDGSAKIRNDSSKEFRPIPAADFRDSLSQSRESLSSHNSGGGSDGDADGDCECDSSGSGTPVSGSERAPCDIGLLERLLRTHPVWFLPGIQRAGAFHLLQGKEEGNFVVRQSSQTDTMALSVRLPLHAGPYIEHYLIHASSGRIGLETSQNKFDNIPDLVAHYSQCCDELPVQLVLPRALREAKNRQQLSSLALLGQEFWRYPMANPKPNGLMPETPGQSKVVPTNQLCAPTPMSQTPSDTSSSFSSFSAGVPRTPHLADGGDSNIVLNLTPVDNSCGNQTGGCVMSTFKGNSSPPNLSVSRVMGSAHNDGSAFVRAPRPTPPNTLNLLSSTAHITHQSSSGFPQTPLLSSQSGKNLPPPPPPRWAKPPFNNNNTPCNEIQAFSPTGGKTQMSAGANITVTTTVTFSVHNQNNPPLEDLLSPNNESVKSDGSTNNNNSFDDGHNSVSSHLGQTSKRLSPEGECINIVPSPLQSSLRRRQNQELSAPLISPSPQTTPFSPEPILSSFNSKGVFSPTNQVASPNGSNSVTSGIFSPSQINSPLSNATISSKSGMFSPSQVTSPALNKSELFSPMSRSSPISGKSSVFSPVSNQTSFTNNSAFNSPLMGKERDSRILSPNTNTVSTTTSGRSRKSKHSHRKESRHYQESDILESPGVYYRSSLGDKVSDYEDIWGPEHGAPQTGTATNRSTFRPNRDALGSGMLISKRPDLLPDTLPKVTSLNSNVLSPSSPTTTDNDSDKEHNQFIALKLAAQQKLSQGSTEQVNIIIATTNSKGEPVPKRPDKLNLLKNANEQMTNDTIERLKQNEFEVIVQTDEEIERENLNKNIITDECLLLTSDFCNSTDEDLLPDKQNSPFYADPVDAIKEAVAPLVQRRRVVRGMPGIGPSQRYSEPPTHGHPYLPLRDMHSIEELSPSSPNTSSSVDNLVGLKSGRPRGKAVQPPRIKPVPVKQDQTWTVDSSWEFISKQGDGTPIQDSRCREEAVNGSSNLVGGAFPSLAEQLSRLDCAVPSTGDTLTIHQVLAQRFPELNLSPYPTLLKTTGEVEATHEPLEDTKGYRMSSYDNVEARLAVSSQASDDGTVFSEPWDCSHWDSFLPPNSNDEPLSFQSSQIYDAEDDDSSTARERSVTPPPGEAPVRLATISRAKSFRDRLDPLLAPPRLQALRGSRGRASPGGAVRAYALHLANDKTTIFAQNVDNFISCTKESKETCPHVVMRNMRQFMSGMKNYLVKHGEREFEKEVEKERLKLKSNEFLNLDAILEGVLHGAVVSPLRSHVYNLLADKFARNGDIAKLTQGMRMAKALSTLRLGIRPSVRVPSDLEMVVISQYFVKMQEADSPLDKLDNLLLAISSIFNVMKTGHAGAGNCPPLGADDFLPVLVLVLARCNIAGAELEAELMAGLLPPPLLAGEGGYYLTTLFGAVAVLKKLGSGDETNKSADWHTGSIGSGLLASTSAGGGCSSGGVARVLVPDESSGALRCVALPWRPGARARDLCRQLAHRARITNPQDYALFALRDGEETLMNDTDYPQDLVESNKTNCMLAYKRIDAKIAWPKQALQSYP